ncbi:hypothetical protein ILUMI_20478, partial [Ignelater luminosus]
KNIKIEYGFFDRPKNFMQNDNKDVGMTTKAYTLSEQSKIRREEKPSWQIKIVFWKTNHFNCLKELCDDDITKILAIGCDGTIVNTGLRSSGANRNEYHQTIAAIHMPVTY